ncbi:MAG: CotH kinase family protein [Clostridia bacterium]|nr:CotH kinase family protein [Clostridia bacterium]
MFRSVNKSKCIVAAGLVVLLVAVFLGYRHMDRAYVEPPDAYGTPISVEAFSKGYDAILEELSAPPEASAPTPVVELIRFSTDATGSAFLKGDQTLEMSATDGATRIYYTTDGSDPRTSDSIRRYIEPLKLKASRGAPAVYHIAAAAFYGSSNSWSEVTYRTYFVGKNIDDQFRVMVYSITAPEESLWDPVTGVLHNNNQFQHGRAWEREIQVQLFDSDGTLMFDMPAGIRIYGGYSRAHVMKSMRIIARPEYDALLDDFDSIDLFGLRYDDEGVLMDHFEDLVIRNTGNDFGDAHLRDEYIHTLMAQQGFVFTEPVRPCLVYINGELYGFFWTHEPYKESYFERRFDSYGYQGEFVVLDGHERNKSPDGKEHDGFDPLEDYNAMLALSEKDLTIDENYEALCRVLDVDSYLRLNATMSLVNNGDWPQNNNRVFKYFAAEGEDFSDVYGMDGKWYFVPHDTDWGLRHNAVENTLLRYYDTNAIQYSPLFCHLMEREDCRQTYVTYFVDMMNGAFAPDHMEDVLDDMVDEMRDALALYLDESPYVPANFDLDKFDRKIETLRTYVLIRTEMMLMNVDAVYELGEAYELTVDVPNGAGVQINTLRHQGDFEGTYYENYDTILRPIVPLGHEFDHWIINGKPYYLEEKTIPLKAIEQGKVEVTMVLRPKKQLYISKIDYMDGEDYIVLTNYGSEDVSTLGYGLTDDSTLGVRFRLPVMTVKAGESVVIYGKNYDPTAALRQLQLEFNFSRDETVWLTYTDPSTMQTTTVDSVRLPKLHEGYVYERNVYDGRFYEIPK